MSFRLWKGHGHPSLWNVEWNREGDPIHLWTMTDDSLDELRRVLDIGMGDCDHCKAWKQYTDRYPEVISHDMKRLNEHDLWLKGHALCLEAHSTQLIRLEKDVAEFKEWQSSMIRLFVCGGEPCEFVKGVAEQGDIATAGLHALAKCIDDLKQDVGGIHKETDWATHMGERFNLATADIDKMKEDISAIKGIIKLALKTG